MTPLVFALAALAGGLGAASRYLVDVGIGRLLGTRFPWGILVVNLSGSLVLGLIVGALPDTAFVVGAGFLGGYSTFSTAMIDTVELWRRGERGPAVFNALGMLVLGILAALAGLLLGTAIAAGP